MNLCYLDWRYIMDWVVVASCFVTVCTIVIDLIKSSKDKTKLSDEHGDIEANQNKLEAGHGKLENIVREEHRNTEHLIEKETGKISYVVNNIDKMIYTEQRINEERYRNLTVEQRDLKKYVEAISTLMSEVERLQDKTVQQEHEIQQLTSQLNEYNHCNDLENKFTQTIE